MPNVPLVSVIVVARNSEKYLVEAIDSIIAQTYPNLEIILVDGQSSDNTATIAKSYPQIKYVYQDTLGLSNARNLGIENTKGEFLSFLDSDNRWSSDKVELQAQILINNPEIQYVSANLQLFTTQDDENLRQGYQENVLKEAKWARTPGILMARKELFNRVGMFATEYKIAGDLEWFVKVQKQNIPTFALPNVLLYKRIRDNSLSTRSQVNRQEVMRVLHKYMKS